MSQSTSQSGETNFFALALLVLFTVFLLVTVTNSGEETQNFTDRAATTAAQSADQTADNSSTAENPFMPAGIPVDENAVVENRMISRGSSDAMQQVISFETSLPASEIVAAYQDWMNQHDYRLERERVGNLAASLMAINGEKALVVVISHFTNTDTRFVEIINYDKASLQQ
ncbi:MAG: hypothetical protein WD335_00985 [Candidatus Paceibacterota bacterium]